VTLPDTLQNTTPILVT